MSSGSYKLNKVYVAIFFALLFIITLMPLFFYKNKFMANPKDFKPQDKNFTTIEVMAYNVSPYVAPIIKNGEVQIDYNGEENARILEIISIEPSKIGSYTVDGKTIDIVSPRKDVHLLLRVRIGKAGDEVILWPGIIDLRAGNSFTLKFKDYILQCEIAKVNKEK